MAKPARFKVGSSGSGKHTEMQGDGRGMGGAASEPAERGPRIGAGVLGERMKPEYDRDREGRGGRTGRGMKTYSEE